MKQVGNAEGYKADEVTECYTGIVGFGLLMVRRGCWCRWYLVVPGAGTAGFLRMSTRGTRILG